jgi:hypothetical protein
VLPAPSWCGRSAYSPRSGRTTEQIIMMTTMMRVMRGVEEEEDVVPVFQRTSGK